MQLLPECIDSLYNNCKVDFMAWEDRLKLTGVAGDIFTQEPASIPVIGI